MWQFYDDERKKENVPYGLLADSYISLDTCQGFFGVMSAGVIKLCVVALSTCNS